MNNKHSYNDDNGKMIYDEPLFLKLNEIENTDNLDNIKTVFQEYSEKELNLNVI